MFGTKGEGGRACRYMLHPEIRSLHPGSKASPGDRLVHRDI